ncbi:GNAT family N-acetyltransferase [Corynebacterium fournieri]|uniref:GNAT family N-acetyltransferase n=1 Tax=Corynebacterium fournieri TaxID=1852390 RepID=UPI000A2F5CD1|nr:GNAT family N-acetyltransferase [Corynebacterium fournieri]WJY97285.1 Putative ribosomal N-acetyltransferase YdaF [Corynebacterium fournieri]
MPTNGQLQLLPWRDVAALPGVRGDIVASCNDPHTVRWTTVPHPYTSRHAEEFLAAPPPHVQRWAYVVDGRYCGNIELRLPDGTLGYNTAPWARGGGLTTQAAKLVTGHAFAQGLPRVEIHVAEGNAASRRVAEKAGFIADGLLPETVRLRGHEDRIVRYVALAHAHSSPNSTAIAP